MTLKHSYISSWISALLILVPAGIAAESAPPTTEPSSDSRAQIQAQAKGEVDKQKQTAREQASKTLDSDAIAAIKETVSAIDAISKGNTADALAAIERATGKINVLLARNPSSALIPVDVTVDVIDAAPLDVKAIKTLAVAAQDAVIEKDYPQARALLEGMVSEIRVRTTHLPLATYPIAMQEAARLLDQKKTPEARETLETALHTLVEIDHVTPLPLVMSEAAVKAAQEERDKDKAAAQRLLKLASTELERARELGYAGKDPEYAVLDDSIRDLEKQLNGGGDTRSAFAKLKDRIAGFFKHLSESEKKSSEVATVR